MFQLVQPHPEGRRETGTGPRGMAKGTMPKRPLESMNTPSPFAAAFATSPGLAAASIAACAFTQGLRCALMESNWV
jgi:hypothetical protein